MKKRGGLGGNPAHFRSTKKDLPRWCKKYASKPSSECMALAGLPDDTPASRGIQNLTKKKRFAFLTKVKQSIYNVTVLYNIVINQEAFYGRI